MSIILKSLFIVLLSGLWTACSPDIRLPAGDLTTITASQAPTSADLYIGMKFAPNSSVSHYVVDLTVPITSSITFSGASAHLQYDPGNIRTLVPLSGNDLLAGSYSDATGDLVSSNAGLIGSFSAFGGGGNAITGIHAGCALPNGDLILGDENNASLNNVNEYSPNGGFVRTVYQPSGGTEHPAMTNCVALSSTSLAILVAQTWGALESPVALQLTLSANTWSVSQTLTFSALDTQLGTSGSSFWAIVAGQDGNIYFPPFQRSAGTIQKMVVCPASALTAASCSVTGNVMPESTAWIYGAARVPNSNDILVSTNANLYWFSMSAGTYTLVHSYAADGPYGPLTMLIR